MEYNYSDVLNDYVNVFIIIMINILAIKQDNYDNALDHISDNTFNTAGH